MDISVFLARTFGIYYIVMALLTITKSDHCIHVVRELFQNRALVFVLAWLTLIFGILLVVGHSKWTRGLPVIITTLSYLTFIKGLGLAFAPQIIARIYTINRNTLRLVAVVVSIIGGLLLWLSAS